MARIRPRTLKDGKTKAYLVVWIDPSGHEKSRQFARRGDARSPGTAVHFKTQVEAELSRGTYIDPDSGKITFREYVEDWRNNLLGRPGYEANVETMLRLHILPEIGDMRMSAIRRRDVQTMIKALSTKAVRGRGGTSRPMAPSYIEQLVRVVGTIFRAAVIDGVIAASPCVQLRLPEIPKSDLVIPTTEQVMEVADRVHGHYRALVLLAAGTGLRSGELLGLDADRIDFLRRTVRVDRQLISPRRGASYFGPPKTRAGYRTVPLQPNLVEVLAEHLRRYGWGRPGMPDEGLGLPAAACSTDGLLFHTRSGTPVQRSVLSTALRPVLEDMGFPPRSGMHLFRHYYASLLIYLGEDSKTIQVRMGHATNAETMDTYGHLFPRTEDRSGAGLDAVFAGAVNRDETTAASRRPLRSV